MPILTAAVKIDRKQGERTGGRYAVNDQLSREWNRQQFWGHCLHVGPVLITQPPEHPPPPLIIDSANGLLTLASYLAYSMSGIDLFKHFGKKKTKVYFSMCQTIYIK